MRQILRPAGLNLIHEGIQSRNLILKTLYRSISIRAVLTKGPTCLTDGHPFLSPLDATFTYEIH